MFDNLLYQPVAEQLTIDLHNGVLPNAMLFSGNESSGKLTCALELARVLSCLKKPFGEWTCNCPACQKHKALSSTSVLLAGPRSCVLEISAAAKTLLEAASSNASYITAARYLYVRSVRKLTLRFSPILWEGDEKSSKISPALSSIDEYLEELDPVRPLPEYSKLEKICVALNPLCAKLENNFMYDSIPVAHIRRASSWAHFRSDAGKKMMIIENADRMQESVRNALLKILEEPPEDVVFILTTSRRNAIIPTILSRVRTYNFVDRNASAQEEVIRRVFHGSTSVSSVNSYLQSFLPVEPSVCAEAGRKFVTLISQDRFPDIEATVKNCENFEPRILLNVFLGGITGYLRDATLGDSMSSKDEPIQIARVRSGELAAEGLKAVHECINHVNVFNQSVHSALELLASDLSCAFRKYGVDVNL